MTLAPGTSLGPYEILGPLGAGGMGEVYRARDFRLGRDVAVKVLPEHLLEDRQALARYEGTIALQGDDPKRDDRRGAKSSATIGFVVA